MREAYGDPETVTDELVECILKPGLQEGAAEVFLDFISYSGGPLPEDLLPQVADETPVRILWGRDDPWEVVKEGRKYGEYACVDRFIELPGVGHCPMDEARPGQPAAARVRERLPGATRRRVKRHRERRNESDESARRATSARRRVRSAFAMRSAILFRVSSVEASTLETRVVLQRRSIIEHLRTHR